MIQTPLTRVLFKHTLSKVLMGVFAAFLGLLVAVSVSNLLPHHAQAASAKTLNFQARLLNGAGAIVPDGTYNVEFKLYSAATSTGASQGSCTGDAACRWVETRTGANKVTVKAGYLNVYLGSVNDLPSNIWNQQLWLTMNIGGTGASATWDGEMNPRLQLTAVPAAYSLTNYNSATGFSSTLSVAGATGGDQNFIVPDQGAAGTYSLLTSSAANLGYIQNSTGGPQTANFNIQASTNGTSGTVGGIIRAASGGQTVDLFQLQNSAGTVLAAFSAAGNLSVASSVDVRTAGSLTIGGGVATSITLGNSTTNPNISFVGSGQFSTGTGSVSLNGATTVTGTNSLTVTGGTTTLGADLVVDTSTLVVDSTNNRVGVNNASPANTLNVKTPTTAVSNAELVVASDNANVGIVIQTGVSPTVNAFQVRNSTNTVQAGITASGRIYSGAAALGSAHFSVQSGAATNQAAIFRANGSQSANLFELQDSNGNVMSAFNAGANQLTLGRIAASGTVAQGALVFADGTTNGFSSTIVSSTLSADRKFLLPNVLGTTASPATICVYNGISSNCPAATGSTAYVWNTTTVQDQTSFYLRSAAATDVVGVLEGANGQTADLLKLNTYNGSSSTTVARFNSAGNLFVASSVDVNTAAALNIGTTNATSIVLGKTGSNVNTTVNGTATFKPVSGTATSFQIQNSTSGVLFNADTSSVATGGAGRIGIGTASPGATLQIDGNQNAVLGSAGRALRVSGATYTDNATAASGTVATGVISSFAVPTIAATNTGVTYTNAATLYVAGAPTAGTNVTITNPYALYVAGGAAYLGGTVTAAGLLTGQAGATISGGAISLNTTGTANTSIGNATGTFQLQSSGLNVSTAGALTGVTGIATSGAYTQSGTSANTFTGATGFNASGTALTVANDAQISGHLGIGVAPSATNRVAVNSISTQNTNNGSAQVLIGTASTGNVGLVVQGMASRTVPLAEFQSNDGNPMFVIGSGGSNNIYALGQMQVDGGVLLNSSSSTAGSLTKRMTAGTGGVTNGDVVVLVDESANARVVRTSTAKDIRVYGVATATASAGSTVGVALSGNTSVNADAAAVAIGDQLVTSATSGQVTVDNGATTGIVGYATTTKAAGASGSIGIAVRVVNGQTNPNFAGNVTIAGLLTGQAGATISGGAISLNATGTANTSIGNATGTLTLAGSSLLLNAATMQRSAAGTTAFDLVDASTTTLALQNSGAGVANLTVDGTISAGGNTVLTTATGIVNSTSVQTGNIYLRSTSSSSIPLVVEGANGQTADLFRINSYNGTTSTTLVRVDSNGNMTVPNVVATASVTSPVFSSQPVSGAGNSASVIFKSGSAANGNSGNVFLDAGSASGTAGALSIGANDASAITIGRTGLTTANTGALTVSQLLTGQAGATISGGAISLNTTGTANTSIGNATGTFQLQSSGLNVSTAGALTGVSGITTSGAYTQSGSGVNAFTGATTVSNTLLVQPGTGSAAALQVQTPTNSVTFTVDTASTVAGGSGRVGVGTGTPSATLQVTGNQGSAALSVGGLGLRVTAATYTDTGTAASGTVSTGVANSFGAPTFAASNAGVTYTNGATLYIAGAPVAGTNVSITNPYALYVASGSSVFGGSVTSSGGFTATSGTGFTATSAAANAISLQATTPTAANNSSMVRLGNSIVSGSANGTFLGINAASSFTGDYLNFQTNSTSALRVSAAGDVTASGTVQGVNLNATTAIQLNGANINTAGTLSNVVYADSTQTISGVKTFSATGTALIVNNDAQISGRLAINTTPSANNRLLINAPYNTTNTTNAETVITASAANKIPLVIQVASSPTANALQIQNSSGSAISGFQGGGGLYVASGSPLGSTAFSLSSGTAGNSAMKIQASPGQTADLVLIQDSSANVNFVVNATGNQLTLGRISGTGTVTQGRLVLADGTTSNFGSTLQSSTLTAARTINLPDEDGTVCLQNSNNCGFALASVSGSYVQLAPTAVQADSTANNTIFINKTNNSGNIVQLQKSGSDVFTVSNSGSVILTNSLQLTSASSTTNNSRVSIQGTVQSSSANQYGTQNQVSFNPQAANTTIYGMVNAAVASGSANTIDNLIGMQTSVSTTSGYTGSATVATALNVGGPSIAGSQLFPTYHGVRINNNAANGGNTSGTITNYQLRIGDVTAAAAAGGTVNNFGINLTMPSGSGAGTTNNYGIFIRPVGQSATEPMTTYPGNYALLSMSAAPSALSGALTIGGLLSGQAGATIAGAATNINASSNFTTNINTGTSTGAVNIGNSAAGAVSVQSASTVGVTGTTTITGRTTGDALTVSNATSAGNILVLQDNATAVMTVADGGAITLQNTSDSAAAFRVLSQGNSTAFSVDTQNQRVGIGKASPSVALDVNGAGQYTGNIGANSGLYLGQAIQGSLASTSLTGFNNQTAFEPLAGSTVTNVYGFQNLPILQNSSKDTNIIAGYMQVRTAASYTGNVNTAKGLEIAAPSISSTGKFSNYYGIQIANPSANGGNTSGTVINTGLRVESFTASPGVGGSVTNEGVRIIVPNGDNTNGTVNNRGLYITGNSGAGTNNYAIYSDSTAQSLLTGALTVNGVTTVTRNGSGTGDASFALTGAPVADATSSLFRMGNSIASGNTTANGGTYFAINAPSTGAGSAADFINFQKNGTSVLKLDTNGSLTVAQTTTTGNIFAVKDSGANTVFNVASNGGAVIATNQLGAGGTVGTAKFSVSNTADTIGQVIKGNATQTQNLFQIQDSSNNINAAFNNTGAQLTLGRSAATGTTTAGTLKLNDGTTTANRGATLQVGTLTASRTITLPDADGTVCLDSGNCNTATSGYIQFAPASAQTDSTANSSIFINKTGAGNLLQFQTNGTDSLTVSNSGNLSLIAGDLRTGGTAAGNIRVTNAGALQNITGYSQTAGAFTLQANAASVISTTTGALDITSAAAATWSTTSGNLAIRAGGASNLTFGTNGSQWMSINSAGYVGINTAPNSSWRLSLDGSMQAKTSNGGEVSFIADNGQLTITSGNDAQSQIDFRGDGNEAAGVPMGQIIYHDTYGMIFRTNQSAADRLLIDASGNVGVGIGVGSVPSASRFNVSNGTGTDAIARFRDNTTDVFTILDGGAITMTSTPQSTASTNTQNITIGTGNATGTTSTAGNISLDVGSSTTGSGSILIGTAARTQTITIGNSSANSNIRVGQNGGTLQLDGTNFDVSTGGVVTLAGGQTSDITTGGNAITIKPGASTTGSALTLQGGNATTANNNGGNVAISGGTGAGTGVLGLVQLAPTQFSYSGSTQTFGANGSATGVDSYSTIAISATASNLNINIPNPVNAVVGRLLYVSNVGSNDFTIVLGGTSITIVMKPNSTATLIWNGNGWTAAGASSSTDLQAAYNNTASSAGAAELVLKNTATSNGLTVRNGSGADEVDGGLLEVQSTIGTNLFSVNNYATEFASNGGAETQGASATTFPASTWAAAPGGGTVTRENAAANFIATGIASVKVVTTAANHGTKDTLNASLISGRVYQVSFTGKLATAGSSMGTLAVIYSNNGTADAATCSTTLGSSYSLSGDVWSKVSCTFTATGTITSANAVIIRQTDATGRTLYIDNLSVTEISATTTPSNVQIGGGLVGGQPTLLTLDRFSNAPVASGNSTYFGSMYYDTTTGRIQCYEADGWGACGSSPDNIITLTPEYTGAVLNGTGVGTLTADFCANGGGLTVNTGLCSTSGEARNYYKWTSPQPTDQTYSIYVNYKLPSTFKEFFDDNTIKLTALTDNATTGKVTYEIYRKNVASNTITQCGTATDVTSTFANTWRQISANGNEYSTCQWAGGDYVVFKINVTARSNANVYVENLDFRFTNQ